MRTASESANWVLVACSSDHTIFYPHIVDLLAEQHATDLDPAKDNALPIEETDGMPALGINGHVADFNVRGPIGPLAHMESTHHNITPQNRHLIYSSPDELDFLSAVNGHVLRIVARLDEDGIAFPGCIDRCLKRDVIPGSIQGNHEGPRTKWGPLIGPHQAEAPKGQHRHKTQN